LFEVVYNGVGMVQTQIYVPNRYYPDSFSVDSNSSQWTKSWDESSRILTVNASLQSKVKITINPGPAQGKALFIGKVTNIDTGAAVVGVTVATNGYHATTGSGGTYSMEVALGTYNLTASSNGYEGKTKTINASEEKTYTVDFALTPTQAGPPDWRLPRTMILVGGVAVIAVAVIVVLLAVRRKRRSV
jgi:CHASE1-domain containing sensor protein